MRPRVITFNDRKRNLFPRKRERRGGESSHSALSGEDFPPKLTHPTTMLIMR